MKKPETKILKNVLQILSYKIIQSHILVLTIYHIMLTVETREKRLEANKSLPIKFLENIAENKEAYYWPEKYIQTGSKWLFSKL